MTQQDRSYIIKELAKENNWRMLAGFIASTVITVASVVWTGATYFYGNKADIKEAKDECRRENAVQDQKINGNTKSIERIETFIYER